MADSPLRFDEYWQLFVRAHESVVVRRVQAAAVTTGIGLAVLGIFSRRASLVVVAPAVALVPTWVARRVSGTASVVLPHHAGFRFAASLKMWGMTLAGAMEAEVARVMSVPPEEASDPADDDRPHPPPNMVTDHTLH